MPPVSRQRVWCGVPRDPGLGAGSGCGSTGRATAGPGGGTGVRASGGVRPSAPPHNYINARCHCGSPRNSVGKQQCHLETGGSNDGHWHLRTGVYRIVIYVPAPMSNVTMFRYFIGTGAPGLLLVPDQRDRGRCWPRNLPTRPASVTVPGALAFGMGQRVGTEGHDKAPWAVSPIPLQEALAMGASGTASTRLKQCPP